MQPHEADKPLRITDAKTLPWQWERPEFEVPDKAQRIEGYDKLMDELKADAARLTLADRAQLVIDNVKLYAALSPYLFKTIVGVTMKNWKTTVTGIVGAAAVLVQSVFGVVIPQEAIIAIAVFLVGLFSSDAKND